MATAKKKTSAKRTTAPKTKYAAKAASTAQAAQRSGVEWVKSGTAQWQKGAQDWAKQSAKLYQFPLGDVNEATKKAAEHVQSATENMMGFAQQMFDSSKKTGFDASAFSPAAMFKNSNFDASAFNPAALFKAPGFDASEAHEKLNRFAKESAEQLNKSASNAQSALNEGVKLARENGEVIVEVTNIAVSLSKELGAELITYLNKTFSQNVELSKQVLTCRTLNDLFDLGSATMKTNLDSFFSESIKLSEKLFRSATEVTEPLNERVSETTERLSKVLAS